jgi:hypothetical protein
MADLRPRPGRWDAQLRLANAGVAVLGGTGSHAAWALAAAVIRTDVSGVWQCDWRTRFTVYLSRMVLDLELAGACVLTQAAAGPHRLLALVALTKLFAVATELLVFMHTDVYFLLQDLLRSRNLYQEASVYVRHLVGRCVRRSGSGSGSGSGNRTRAGPAPHPLAGLRAAKRRIVRCCAFVMVAGSAGSLVLACLVVTRVTLVLVGRALHTPAAPSCWLVVADAVTAITILGGLQALWAAAWWRRHAPRVRKIPSAAPARLIRLARPAGSSRNGARRP